MKKIIAAFMSVIFFAMCVLPSFAIHDVVGCSLPIIQISGDSKPIYDSEGNLVYSTKKIQEVVNNMVKGQSKEDVIKTLLSKMLYVLSAYYINGCIFQDFDEYYKRIYDTISPLFEKAHLDKNGEVWNDTGVSKSDLEYMNYCMNTDFGSYDTNSYRFIYDWRLDPLEVADQLKVFIDGVKRSTGYEKIGILCRCVGANIFMAYVSKYGVDDICGVAFDGVAVNGCEILTEPVAGKFNFDANAINRLLIDLDGLEMVNVDPKIIAAIDFADKSGMADFVKFCIKFPNYNRMLKGITSALSLATFYTWPNYWACFSEDDYRTGLDYVFGAEGSEKRTEYAGLIAKLDNYDRQVRQKLPELMNLINDNCNLVIISKYGFQHSPITTSKDKIGDQLISVTNSSFGATTGTIFEDLSDEYVAERIAEGKGKYVSPDRKVDASTCMFPDQTFFVKGASHSDWTQSESEICSMGICADHQITVDEYSGYHFRVYNYDTNTSAEMTTENCNTEFWTVDESERSDNPVKAFTAYVKSVKNLFNALKSK